MTTVPLGATVAEATAEPDAASAADRATAQFADVTLELVVAFFSGLLGLAVGRIISHDIVVTVGIIGAVSGGVLMAFYNRVYLVGTRGQSMGKADLGLAVLDRKTRHPVGIGRAALRESIAIVERALLGVLIAALLVLGARVVISVFDGVVEVVAFVVVEVLILAATRRLISSEFGERAASVLSLHDRVAHTTAVEGARHHGLPEIAHSSLHQALFNFSTATWVPITLFSLYWFGTLSWSWPNGDRSWFPPAYEVWQSLNSFWFFERFSSDIIPTLWTLILGITFTLVVGLSLGVFIGTSKRLTQILRPLLDFTRSIPKILLITPIVALAGSGSTTSVLVIISGALWPLLLGTIDGIAGIGSISDDVSRAYRISTRDRYLKMILPAAAPNIFAGLRTSLSVGVILLVVVQSIGEARGLGYHLRAENNFFRFENMWSSAVLLALLGYFLNVLLSVTERRVLHWFYAKGTDV